MFGVATAQLGCVGRRRERKLEAEESSRTVDESGMLREKIKAQNEVMRTVFEYGKQNGCFLVSDAYASCAHSDDRRRAAVGDSNYTGRWRRKDFVEMAAKARTHDGDLSAGVDKSSYYNSIDKDFK